MSIFIPDFQVKSVVDIDTEFLFNNRISALLLDVDNTLALSNDPVPFDGVVEWVKSLTQSGVKLIIISNNSANRVGKFAKILGLPFISRAAKPLPFGFAKAARLCGVSKSDSAIVGDQIFTDIAGARLAGVKSILVEPAHQEGSLSFRIRRKIEKKILHDKKISGNQK